MPILQYFHNVKSSPRDKSEQKINFLEMFTTPEATRLLGFFKINFLEAQKSKTASQYLQLVHYRYIIGIFENCENE